MLIDHDIPFCSNYSAIIFNHRVSGKSRRVSEMQYAKIYFSKSFDNNFQIFHNHSWFRSIIVVISVFVQYSLESNLIPARTMIAEKLFCFSLETGAFVVAGVQLFFSSISLIVGSISLHYKDDLIDAILRRNAARSDDERSPEFLQSQRNLTSFCELVCLSFCKQYLSINSCSYWIGFRHYRCLCCRQYCLWLVHGLWNH